MEHGFWVVLTFVKIYVQEIQIKVIGQRKVGVRIHTKVRGKQDEEEEQREVIENCIGHFAREVLGQNEMINIVFTFYRGEREEEQERIYCGKCKQV